MQVYFDEKILNELAEKNDKFTRSAEKLSRALRNELGFNEDPVPFDEEKMKKALEHPAVKQVRVFRMKMAAQEKKKAKEKSKRKAQKKARRKGR